MNLADRLNKALAAQNLSVQASSPTPEPKLKVVFESLDLESIDFVAENIDGNDIHANKPLEIEDKIELWTLTEALTQAKSVEPDEFGTRVILVKEVDLEEIHLPQVHGEFVIDDIQKRNNGIYEVHLVENNQK